MIYRPYHVCLCGGIGIRLNRLLPTIKRQIDGRRTRLARRGYTLGCGDDNFRAVPGDGESIGSTRLGTLIRLTAADSRAYQS